MMILNGILFRDKRMPLSEAQKEFINSCIDYTLDFSTEISILTDQIAKLKEIFAHSVTSNHDFHDLQKFLCSPNESLLGLEQYANKDTDPPTLSDIQNYILQRIEQEIAKCVAINSDLFRDLKDTIEQNKDKIIKPENITTLFKTTRSPIEFSLPWEHLHLEDQIFRASIVLDENRAYVVLNVSITYPDQSSSQHQNPMFRSVPDSNRYHITHEYNYLYSLIDVAQYAASHMAKGFLLNYLYEKNYIDGELFGALNKNLSINDVITHRYYLEQLLNGNIAFSLMAKLESQEAANLINPTIQSLLKNNLCDLETACGLTINQALLCEHYYSLLKDNRLSVKEIACTSDDEAVLLLLPVVIHLIHQSKLTFSQAKTLGPTAKDVLGSPLYGDFFLRKKIAWDKMSRLAAFDHATLKNNLIAALIVNELIDITELPTLPRELLVSLQKRKINTLVLAKKLTIKELRQLSIDAIEMISQHPYLYDWILHGVISMNDVDVNHLFNCYSLVYFNRLVALMQGTPLKLYNSTDSTKQITEELVVAAYHCERDEYELVDSVNQRLIEHIKKQLGASHLSSKEKKLLFRHLQHHESNVALYDAVDAAIQLEHRYNEKIHKMKDRDRHAFKFFGRTPFNKLDRARDAIREIVALDAYVRSLKVKNSLHCVLRK